MGNAARVISVNVKLSLLEMTIGRKLAKEAGIPFGRWLILPRRHEMDNALKQKGKL